MKNLILGAICLAIILSGCSHPADSPERQDPPEYTRPDKPVKPDDDDNADEQSDKEALGDRSTRYESAALALYLDTSGTIFSISSDEESLTVRSLSTGDCASIRFGKPLPQVANGTEVDITENGIVNHAAISLVKRDGTDTWIKIQTAPEPTWLVVNNL